MAIDFSQVKAISIPEGDVKQVSLNGIVLWKKQTGPSLKTFNVSWARTWMTSDYVNGDAFTRTNSNVNAFANTGNNIGGCYIAYKIDDGTSNAIWTSTGYRTGFTTTPEGSKITLCIIFPGGAIGSASSYSTNQDAQVTLPSSSTSGYTLVSNTTIGKANNNARYGVCRRVILEYTGDGTISITGSSTHSSSYYPRFTISIS